MGHESLHIMDVIPIPLIFFNLNNLFIVLLYIYCLV